MLAEAVAEAATAEAAAEAARAAVEAATAKANRESDNRSSVAAASSRWWTGLDVRPYTEGAQERGNRE